MATGAEKMSEAEEFARNQTMAILEQYQGASAQPRQEALDRFRLELIRQHAEGERRPRRDRR